MAGRRGCSTRTAAGGCLKARPKTPRGREWFYDHDREVLLKGPANTDKSRGVLEKFHFCCEKYGGIRVLIVRQTRESYTDSVLAPFESKAVPPGHPILRGPDRANRQRYI